MLFPSRVREVDALRGFALLGILLVNAQVIAGPHVGAGGTPVASAVDGVAAWLVTALVAAKFYPLFAFLFGYSFTLQRAAADRAGAPFAPRHLRRLLCLLALGLAHGALLFSGDILTVYAVLSLVLFALRDVTPRTAVRTAAWLVAGCAGCLLAWGLLTVAYAEPVGAGEAAAWAEERVAAYRGGPGDIVGANLRALRDGLGWNLVYGLDVLAALLAGLAAGRAGLLAAPGRHRARLRRGAARTLPVGLAGGVVMAVCRNGPLDRRWYDVGSAVGVLTAPALTAAYVCGLLLLLDGGSGRRVAAVLAPAGRLALTHYLSQSLVLALVFTGYGLAWYGRVGTAALLAGCLVLYGVQLAVSGWVTRRFRYGPAEWVLRGVTVGLGPGSRVG
ncbi:DUF418 domain-containing protein [Streptomyces sp. NPDC006997]|uniref:DUF418 domain-containing protein n=1 Tax=Streptomyces sp. NPDC006997 TaxID=3155356 RepID=UPI00340A82AC